MADDLVIRLCDERTALQDANRSLIERNANLEAEVARLREERHEWASRCEDERAAHEATRRSLAHTEDLLAGCNESLETWQGMHADAESAHEATRAELAEIHKLVARGEGHGSVEATAACIVDRVLSMRIDERCPAPDDARAALSSARELLERLAGQMGMDDTEDGQAALEWLRAHPELFR